jgi:hypothetical protein
MEKWCRVPGMSLGGMSPGCLETRKKLSVKKFTLASKSVILIRFVRDVINLMAKYIRLSDYLALKLLNPLRRRGMVIRHRPDQQQCRLLVFLLQNLTVLLLAVKKPFPNDLPMVFRDILF